MTDLHCHILPGVDDGAVCLEESLDMAALAADSGITRIVCTPHLRCEGGRPSLSAAAIGRLCAQLQVQLDRAEIPVRLLTGGELLCLPEALPCLEQGLIPTLGGSDYLLTEFPFDASEEYITGLLERAHRYCRPVVAHPERYAAVVRNPDAAAEWAAQGCLLQLNKGSLLGAFGSRIRTTALELFRRGLCHVIAGDAHGAERRTPSLHNLFDYFSDRYPPEYLLLFLEENPRRILENREVLSPQL